MGTDPHQPAGLPRVSGVTMDKKKTNKKKQPIPIDDRRFKVGDLAVYPAHGVGRIEAIESKVINGRSHDFYILKVLENGMVIMIPTDNVDSVGLRDVISEDEIPKVYAVMGKKGASLLESQTWNRRYREYMEKIKTGSLYDVAEVFRDLSQLKFTKDLSFGERKLYDTAQILLVKEISTARQADPKLVASELESLVGCMPAKSVN